MLAQESVLFANETFYQALADGNYTVMDALWSREAPVTCIHPGQHPLCDREQIMATWQQIFANGSSPTVCCHAPEAFVSRDTGFVVCYELVADTMLIATNIFRREDRRWRMVHHQAGPTITAASQLAIPGHLSHTVH